MESLRDIAEINIKRASILSAERFSGKIASEGGSQKPPKDKYFFTYILFFFYGLSNILAFMFFIIANDFWMYKFRNISQPTYNSTNKTDLQVYFASATNISQSIPCLATAILTALYGHKIHLRTRVLGIQLTCFLMFAATTATVQINTDSWQIEFFYMILVIYMVITVASIYFQVCIMTLISKFPPIYTKVQMYGCGAAGIFSAILQIVCLAISDGSTTTAAMIYFTSGTMVIFITLTLAYLSKYSEHHEFYFGDGRIDTKKQIYTIKEIWETTKKTWSCQFIFCASFIVISFVHPNITCLVVSEYYDTGTIWNRLYFVPVVTFLTSEIFSQLTRIITPPLIKENNQWFYVLLFFIRTIILGPIFLFCRTSPKVHSPLWFPHDWQYILILIANASTFSFFYAISFLSIPRLAGEQTELAFILIQTYSSIVICLVSPFGAFLLKLL